MAEIVFYREGVELFSFPLDQDLIRMGQGEENEVSFKGYDVQVLELHAQIERVGDNVQLRDLSGEGIVVNGVLQSFTALRNGDNFILGNCLGVFKSNEFQEDIFKAQVPSNERTVPLFPEGKRRVTKSSQALLSYTDEESGQLKEVFLTSEKKISIGRDLDNDIVISSPYVSKHHCRIFWKAGRFAIVDMGSTNGIQLGDHRVFEGELAHNTHFWVGNTEFIFQFVREEERGSKSIQYSGGKEDSFHGIISQDSRMKSLFRQLERFAQTNSPVLITGESGTGKELFARAIYELSPRHNKPYLAINCGAINKELITSTFFGHVRGAFTGAKSDQDGLFGVANGGTIFLDEIAELPQDTQTTLLRVLETGRFFKLGSTQELQTDARIIAATNRSLEELSRHGAFRYDLYFRLNVLELQIPPLRERIEDIPLLIESFLPRFSQGRTISFTSAAIEKMMKYHWPGNVRELLHFVERLVVSTDASIIGVEEIEFAAPSSFDNLPAVSFSSFSSLPALSAVSSSASFDTFSAPNFPAASTTLNYPLHHSSASFHQYMPQYAYSGGPQSFSSYFVSEDKLAHHVSDDRRAHHASDDLPAHNFQKMMTLEEMERKSILDALERANGVVAEAAVFLNISRSTIYSKMKKLGINYKRRRRR